ncbi:unnamed protein product [Rhizophagus irregularis]|nr:unnamed protein product [Rhizophagus irregularis]
MKTPIFINGIEIKAIVDTGAATCAISKGLLVETGNEIERSSNDEYTDDEEDPTYENNEEIETFRVEDLEEEYISEDEEEVK